MRISKFLFSAAILALTASCAHNAQAQPGGVPYVQQPVTKDHCAVWIDNNQNGLKDALCSTGPGGGVITFNTRTGDVTLLTADVTGVLGFTPASNARTITGVGMLTGGGDLTTNRTLNLASINADNIVMNASGSFGTPAAAPLVSCSGGNSALTYNITTHLWGCNTLSTSVTSFNTRTGAITLQSADVSGVGGLLSSNNLSDVGNAATSLSNLGGAPAGQGEVRTTSPTITAANFAAFKAYVNNAGSLNYALPVSTGLQANGGGLIVVSPANSFTITPGSGENINGGSANAAITCNFMSVILTNGSGNDFASCPGTAFSANTGASGHALPYLDAADVWSNRQSVTPKALTVSTATFTPDGTSNHYEATLGSFCPCTIANPSPAFPSGMDGTLEVIQDGTGSRTIGTWGSKFIIPGGVAGITLTTTASKKDIFGFHVDVAGDIIMGAALLNPTH